MRELKNIVGMVKYCIIIMGNNSSVHADAIVDNFIVVQATATSGPVTYNGMVFYIEGNDDNEINMPALGEMTVQIIDGPSIIYISNPYIRTTDGWATSMEILSKPAGSNIIVFPIANGIANIQNADIPGKYLIRIDSYLIDRSFLGTG